MICAKWLVFPEAAQGCPRHQSKNGGLHNYIGESLSRGNTDNRSCGPNKDWWRGTTGRCSRKMVLQERRSQVPGTNTLNPLVDREEGLKCGDGSDITFLQSHWPTVQWPTLEFQTHLLAYTPRLGGKLTHFHHSNFVFSYTRPDHVGCAMAHLQHRRGGDLKVIFFGNSIYQFKENNGKSKTWRSNDCTLPTQETLRKGHEVSTLVGKLWFK